MADTCECAQLKNIHADWSTFISAFNNKLSPLNTISSHLKDINTNLGFVKTVLENINSNLSSLDSNLSLGFSSQYNILGGIHGTINSRLGEIVVKLSDINSSLGSYESVNVVNDIIIDSNNYAYVGKGDMTFTDL